MSHYVLNRRTLLIAFVFILPLGLLSCSSKESAKKVVQSKKSQQTIPIISKAVQQQPMALCSITINKDKTWSRHSVLVNAINYAGKAVITSFKMPAQTDIKESVNTITKTFDCHKYQKLQFTAQFSPAVWSTNKGKDYLSRRFYDISGSVIAAKAKHVKLKLTLNFPSDFIGVPSLIVN